MIILEFLLKNTQAKKRQEERFDLVLKKNESLQLDNDKLQSNCEKLTAQVQQQEARIKELTEGSPSPSKLQKKIAKRGRTTAK
jgi:cell division protein FtsB